MFVNYVKINLNCRKCAENGERHPENADQSGGIITGEVELTHAKCEDKVGKDHFTADIEAKETEQ